MLQIKKNIPDVSTIDKSEFENISSLKIGSESKGGWVVKIHQETIMICFSKEKEMCLNCGYLACKFSGGKER